MKITIELHGITAIVEEAIEVADDALELDTCLRCLIAVGYHPDSVADAVAEWALLDGAIDCTHRDVPIF